jgi:hypothetical protein
VGGMVGVSGGGIGHVFPAMPQVRGHEWGRPERRGRYGGERERCGFFAELRMESKEMVDADASPPCPRCEGGGSEWKAKRWWTQTLPPGGDGGEG